MGLPIPLRANSNVLLCLRAYVCRHPLDSVQRGPLTPPQHQGPISFSQALSSCLTQVFTLAVPLAWDTFSLAVPISGGFSDFSSQRKVTSLERLSLTTHLNCPPIIPIRPSCFVSSGLLSVLHSNRKDHGTYLFYSAMSL